MSNKVDKNFWVVTKPNEVWDYKFLVNYLTIEDICFRTSVKTLMTQAIGGLKPDEVLGVFEEEQAARNYATTVLKRVVSEKGDKNEE